jgi:hypothetical protein
VRFGKPKRIFRYLLLIEAIDQIGSSTYSGVIPEAEHPALLEIVDAVFKANVGEVASIAREELSP